MFRLLCTFWKQVIIHSTSLKNRDYLRKSFGILQTCLLSPIYSFIYPLIHVSVNSYLVNGVGYKSTPILFVCSNCSVANQPWVLLLNSDGNCDLAKCSSAIALMSPEDTRWCWIPTGDTASCLLDTAAADYHCLMSACAGHCTLTLLDVSFCCWSSLVAGLWSSLLLTALDFFWSFFKMTAFQR